MGCDRSIAHDDITDVPGILVGNVSDTVAKTGVTVVLPPAEGASAGVHIGGNATSTRQMDSLRPLHLVDRIHGICLSGGSAFGLDAAGGVLAWLEKRRIGIPVTGKVIPIVPSAVIFDLNFGDPSVRPDGAMGFKACEESGEGPIEQGSIGAGTGATVGKLLGIDHAMKGGMGSASTAWKDLVVGGLVVVNSYGDVHDEAGAVLAGVRESPASRRTANASELLETGRASGAPFPGENTTLAVVAVNARIDKLVATRIAAQATIGIASIIKPFHTQIDGDLTIVMGVGDKQVDPNRIGLLAAKVLQRAVIKAVRFADGFGILPAHKDMER